MSEVIDHVGIRVSDLATSRRMYERALAELGFAVLGEGEFEGDAYILFGRGTIDDFALHAVGTEPGRDRVTTGAHIATSFITPCMSGSPGCVRPVYSSANDTASSSVSSRPAV
jgi:catechol 2,3-dioxygenase-like lactoylglutathione lyase family enzyme